MRKKAYHGKWIFTGNREKPILENFVMMTENARILWVKPAEDAEIEDAEAIDLGDAYVVPGFIDAHVHLFCGESAYEECPGRSAAHHVCQGVKNAQELLKAGVVACRDLGAYEGYTLGVRDSIEKGEINGPKIIACGHALCATGGHGYQISYECDGADEVRGQVRRVIKEGADVVKMMVSGGVNSPGPEPGPCEFTEEEIRAGIETTHALGRKVAVHTHGNTAVRYCVEAGVDSIEHGVFLTEDIMDKMVEQGTYLVPTLCAPYYAVTEGLKADPDNPDHAKSKEVIQIHRDMLKQCADKGVKIAFGTDAGSPYNPYDKVPYEMVLMTMAGLSPRQALDAATSGSAELLGIADDYGSLEEGKLATFLCLKENPLEHIACVVDSKDVYIKGEKL